MNAAEVREEIDRARKLYAKADRLDGKRNDSVGFSDASERARSGKVGQVLRAYAP